MDLIWSWGALVASVLLIGGYELRLWARERVNARSTARAAHAALREEWVRLLSSQSGSEIIAVQTLRNSLMSTTISASTAALALVGTLSLTVPGASQGLRVFGLTRLSPGLVTELMLLATLFASFVCSATAMRYFSHAGFVMSLPVASPERELRLPTAIRYVRRAGSLYGWGLRTFFMVAPLIAGLIHVFAMPVASLVLVLVLRALDRRPQ
jgi:uncharacterized membrane protein